MYNVGSQIKLKASNLSSSLGDYSVAYILVKVTITVPKIPITDTNFMFQQWLYQIKIMQNYCRILKKVSKEQLTGRNINHKSIFKLLNWSKFSGSKKTFCFIIWKW